MTDKRPAPTRWHTTAAAALLALAFFIGWGGYIYSRSVPRYEQLAPGAAGRQGPVTMALTSLTTRSSFGDVTGEQPDLPEGSIFVVASLRVLLTSPPESPCTPYLIDTHGRRWSTTFVNHEVVTICSQITPNTLTEMEAVYVVPRSAIADLAGVTMAPLRGVTRIPVLRPPA